MDAVLKIYGDIGISIPETFMGEGAQSISAKDVSDFLDENKDAQNITVKINSRGGDVQEGWAIYDLLTNSGKKIKTVGEGKVYSIATVIFLAGSEREMLPNSDGVIHMPRITDPEGTFQADDFRNLTEMMDQEEEKILNLYVTVTGGERKVLMDHMKKETTLSAEDMVTMGFATKIREQYKAVAHFNFKSKIAMNEKDVKTFGEKLDLLLAKVTGFSRLPAKNQTLTDQDGKELTLEKESGMPEVGDKATPNGTFVMADGKTITVADGAITAIKEPVVDKTEIELANEKIATLEAKIADVEKTNAEALKAKTEAEAAKAATAVKEAEAVALINDLQALKNSWKPEGRSHVNFTSGKVGAIDIDKVKELTEKQTSKN